MKPNEKIFREYDIRGVVGKDFDASTAYALGRAFGQLVLDTLEALMAAVYAAREGPPPDARLRPAWREAFEDAVWSLVNTREFVWLP